jgi:hypothetical protein
LTIANDAIDGAKLANSVTIAQDLVVSGNFTVNGTTTTLDTTHLEVQDSNIIIHSGSAPADNSGITIGTSGTPVTLQMADSAANLACSVPLKASTFIGSLTGQADTVANINGLAPNTATTQATQGAITSLGTLTVLTVDNVVLDANTITSNADNTFVITAKAGQQLGLESLRVDAGAVTGATAITSDLFTGPLTGLASTATLATNATNFVCTDNESTNETCLLVFVDGATGNQGAETDGDLTYNPSTGTLTATAFSGVIRPTVALKADTQTLIVGVNYVNAMGSDGTDVVTLPASPTVGDVVHVKAPGDCAAARILRISRAGSQEIDGVTQIDLVSANAAVSLYYVANNTWSVF